MYLDAVDSGDPGYLYRKGKGRQKCHDDAGISDYLIVIPVFAE